MVHLNSKCAMEKIIVISALVFIICATVLSLPPPAGFIVYPIYNTTNHTNNSYNQPPGQQNGACMYQNIPEPGTHSIYLGCINYSDRLLYSQIHEKASLWYKGRERIVRYPATGGGLEIITGVRIRDLDVNGQGGFAHLQGGGIGSRFVEMRLYSPRGKGFRFQVNIYGR